MKAKKSKIKFYRVGYEIHDYGEEYVKAKSEKEAIKQVREADWDNVEAIEVDKEEYDNNHFSEE